MRFTLVYRGRIPSRGDLDQIGLIRRDACLQAQLAGLYSVTGRTYATGNRQIVGDTLYTAILPIGWVCATEVALIRATPQSRINGLPDIDNTLKTLLDALCAPAGPAAPGGTAVSGSCHVIAIEDKQISSIAASSDHHWGRPPEEDLAIIRISTRETPIDDAVCLGGQSFASLREHVF